MYYAVYNNYKIVVDELGKAVQIDDVEDAYISDFNDGEGYKLLRSGVPALDLIRGYISVHGVTKIVGTLNFTDKTGSWTYNNIQYNLSAGVITPTLEELT